MDFLVLLIPLLPFLAAFIVGIGHFAGVLTGKSGEARTAGISKGAIYLSCLLALLLLAGDLTGKNSGAFTAGQWLTSASLDIQVNFITQGINVILAALFSVLLVVIFRFATNYMHSEAGFHRFFALLNLFAGAILLLVLAGNAIGTFFGWELAGLCSFLLIAYAYNRPTASVNATRVFVTNRIGDAAFVLGAGLSYAWAGSINWNDLNMGAAQLSLGQATVIALSFAVAAFVKSAQLPFTPWLARSMEGPTPSSAVFYGAVMVHAGVFLVCLLQPVFEQAPFVMALLAVVGAATALYGFLVGRSQTDIKSSLVYSTSTHLGLMFLACGLGFWQLAFWHLCAHAIVRSYLYLTSPSILHNVHDNPVLPVTPASAAIRWLSYASLQRFWVEQMTDWVLTRPVQRLARDLSYFDDHVVDQVMGVPAPTIRTISSLAQREEKRIGARLDNEADRFAQGSGLAGKLTEWSAGISDWFEDRFVLHGVGKDMIRAGLKLGRIANKFEHLVLRPRYLGLFVLITLLITF